MTKSKLFSLIAVAMFFTALFTSCSGGGLPDGRYEPVDDYIKNGVIQAIVINGNNFTQVLPIGGMGITVKYKYKNGTLTFVDGNTTSAFGMACEFKNDTLWYNGAAFVK